MKCIQIVMATIVVLTFSSPIASAQEAKPINLALWDPVQIFKNDTAIHGVRVNIYGKNAELKGVDFGIVNWITGETVGLQWGIVNVTKGDFTGWQTAPVNIADGFMTGIQSGTFFSMNGSGKGLQFSAVTWSDDFVGLQLGIVNYAIQYHGIQIGLINIIKEGGMLPFFPIFNFSFD
jgi:hypothetical protein